jgi:hypothetical protein
MSKNETKKSTWGYPLYYHKTDGGAEYLCSEAVPGTTEGAIPSRLVVRLDGEPEYVAPAYDDALAVMERLTEKVRRANEIQHSGQRVKAEDWAELYQLANEAHAAMKKARGT